MTFVRAQWDRTAAIGFTVLGLLVLLLGWIGVSGADAVVKQLPYIISGGIGGIIIVSVGAVLWVSADLRDEWRELRQLRLQLGELRVTGVLPTPRDEAPTGPLPRIEIGDPPLLPEAPATSVMATAAYVEQPVAVPAGTPAAKAPAGRTPTRRARSTAPAEAPAVVAAHPVRSRSPRRPSDA